MIKNPPAKSRHDVYVDRLIAWLEERNIPGRKPNQEEERQHDVDHDDHGFDLTIGDFVADMKGFGLRLINNSATWDSPHWDRVKNPFRPGLINDFYIFPTSQDVGEWSVMRREDVRLSYKGFGPYCWKVQLTTINKITGQIK